MLRKYAHLKMILIASTYLLVSEKFLQLSQSFTFRDVAFATMPRSKAPVYIPLNENTLYGVLVHAFRLFSARFPEGRSTL